MENQKNNKGVIILLIIIIVILSTLCILLATQTISFKSNDGDNNDITNSNNILEEIVGVWGHNNYMIRITKQNDEYIYLQGQYGTDAGIGGTIKNIKETDINEYKLEIFSKGCTGNDCIEESEDKTEFVIIELDKQKNSIINNNNEYKFITKDISNENEINEFFNSQENWTNYLLSRHILDAKITRNRSKDLGDSKDFSKTETITMDEIEEILSNFKNSKLSKTWSQGRGGQDRDHLTIAYENNEQKYQFEIYYGTITVDKLDDEFKSILEKNKYDEKNTEYKNIEGSFYYYSIDNYNETIFDKYFN